MGFFSDAFDFITGDAERGDIGGSGFDLAATAVGIRSDTRAAREVKRDARIESRNRLKRGEEDEELIRLRARRQAASQRARLGAAGVTGSPLLVVQETLLLAFDEIRRTREAAQLDAFRIGRRGRRAAKALTARAVGSGIRFLGRAASRGGG